MSAKELGAMPAHPVTPDVIHGVESVRGDWIYGETGMTKREAFAMAAMQGLCANPETFITPAADEDEIAAWSVKQADALLAELAKDGVA